VSLYVETSGEGPNVVFLHGWGMNAEVWFEIQQVFEENYRVTVIDLPGHGRSQSENLGVDFDALVELVEANIPDHCILVGWSLGGVVAQSIAIRYPQKLNKLVLVASNAQFQQSDNWHCAMKPEVLENFVQNLHQDYKSTLQQFLMLQALGAENAKKTIRELKQRLFLHGEPETVALENGLLFLKNVSVLEDLHKITIPSLIVNGRLDSLVPAAAGEKMQQMIPQSEFKLIDKAGHAPFLSHSDLFINYLKEFLSK